MDDEVIVVDVTGMATNVQACFQVCELLGIRVVEGDEWVEC